MLTVLLAVSLLAVAAMPLAAGDAATDAKQAAAAPAQDGAKDSAHLHDGRRKWHRHTHNATAADGNHERKRKGRARHNATAAGTHSQKSVLYGGFAQ
jgi:hypothetical protein